MFYDMIAFITSYILIEIYYLYLRRRSRRTPNACIHTVNALIRERWVNMIITSGKQEILAIQTLRNSVMAASFMATTAMLLIIGVLNMGEKIGQWSQSLHPLYSCSDLWLVKLAVLLLSFALAFYYFAMAIRFFNHVGYMINLPCNPETDAQSYKQTCAYLNKAGRYYTFGTRTFFFSLPIISWFFGSIFLVLATLGLLAGLVVLDSVPNISPTKK